MQKSMQKICKKLFRVMTLGMLKKHLIHLEKSNLQKLCGQ